MKTFVTFGQVHTHRVNGKTFDCDCVAVINHERPEQGLELALEYFGHQFCFEYLEDHWVGGDYGDMQYYPRGYIEVNPVEVNP